MIKNNTRMELSYITLYFVTTIISLIQTIGNKKFPGELYREIRMISDFEVFAISFFNLVGFVLCYLLYKVFVKFRVRASIGVKYNFRRLSWLLSVILVLQISFLMATGVGRVTFGEPATSPYSTLFALIKPDPFVFLYFLIIRNKKDFSYTSENHFSLNIIFYCLLKLLQGWSSFFFIFFVLECCVRFRHSKYFGRKMVMLIPLTVIFIGGLVYQQIFVLKNQIRGNNSMQNISYFQAVEHLSSRLSMNATSLGAYQNTDKIVSLYKAEELDFKESKALLRPLIPSKFMDKEFRNLNNNIMHSYTPTLTAGTSSDFGFAMYYYILYKSSKFDFITSILLTMSLIAFAKIYFDTMSNGTPILDFLFFLILFKFTYTVSLENVIGQGFVPYLYLTVFMWLFGGVKFIRTRK
ncbi:hypothetical protein BCU94_09490 [Shewanella sp. 10N.286.52.C2]|uniref:oligosaccharide repeat unit polymerase n=1 Tax=Shewanella sp. 10N.286.52.C2 TaxID=1880838 RepID=UPI000C84ADB7|nr:oligosaccharide repeat unit polymerase [Shewanella sp. 10N.286.52.C2]PMG31171.1 hypothetical protein BCU94_09490 [Shewanella sp. 10N.286.52.C2]